MFTLCNNCRHKLWSEVRRLGSFRFVVCFDDDEGSGSYAERVVVCPECGTGLNGNAIVPGTVSSDDA